MSIYFAVSPNQEKILKAEGIASNKIHTVGNTVSDSLFQHLEISAKKSNILRDLNLDAGEYFLVQLQAQWHQGERD